MFIKISIILISLLIIFLGFAKLKEHHAYKNELIKVQINLINQCELYDKAFMVKALPSGKISKFKDKQAVMYLKRSSKVMLIASNEFPGFHFSNYPVEVSYNTQLVADCSNSERLDNVFDALKKQFNKNDN